MTGFVLFDLDNTLVDSLHVKPLRDARRWPEVYPRIATFKSFEGIAEVWSQLRERGLHLAVVTHSPRNYAEKVLVQIQLSPDILVAYHDLERKLKPLPFGYRLGAAGRPSGQGIAVGDERNDLLAADAFGCIGVFAGWSRDPALLPTDCEPASWTYASRPSDLIPLVDLLPHS
jgi:phosphoglycolate phosphatase-like HAD superfamily hydrolase